MSELATSSIEIVTLPPPRIAVTVHGDLSETDAAVYLSYRMCTETAARTMREWRMLGHGPIFHASPTGRAIWYRKGDLDDWLAECAQDPSQ